MNPVAEGMAVRVMRALSGQLSAAVAALNFEPSGVLRRYRLHEMGGWKMSNFLEHHRSFASEEKLLDAFGWNIEPPRQGQKMVSFGKGG